MRREMVIDISLANNNFSKPFPYSKILIIIFLQENPGLSIRCLLSKSEVLRLYDHGLHPYFTIEKENKHTNIK